MRHVTPIASAAADIDSTSFDDRIWRAIAQSIEAQHDTMLALRRQMHANPEASGMEIASSQLIAQSLREHNLQPRMMADGLGVVADIDLGAPADRFIALRAELDCVQVNDDKNVEYASRKSGLCHACGHDAHTAIVLGALLALGTQRDALRSIGATHNIRAIFQPAEESAAGALSMIRQGAIDNVQAIFAVHVDPFLEPGVIGFRNGPLTSACTVFDIAIKGRSGHTARPFEAIDPIPAAANIVSLLYQLAPRSMDSRYPLALAVASINAGSTVNTIPSEATVRGTLRTARAQDQLAVQQRMEAVVQSVAHATGCEARLTFPTMVPATNNDPHLIDLMVSAATELFGPQAVTWIEVPSMGGEDFAYYQQNIPGAIVRLGAALPDPAQRQPLHSGMFDIDERALHIGAKLLARTAVKRVCGQ